MTVVDRAGSLEGTTIDTECATLELQANDILLVTGKPVEQVLAHAREVVDEVTKLCAQRGRRVRLLVDMRQCRSIAHDARRLYQSEEYAANLFGAALMVGSGLSRVLGNFIVSLNEGPAPARMFTSFEEARAWLESLS